MQHLAGRSALLRAVVSGSLVLLASGCLGPTTIVLHAPRPTDLAKVPGADRVGVELRVVDSRLPPAHPDPYRTEEPVQALVARSVKDQLSALGYQVRDSGPARLTIEIWSFQQRFQKEIAAGSSEADVYLSITASKGAVADCLWDFVHIRVHEDVTSTPAAAAQASLENALGLAMRYLAEKVALHDALMRAARSDGTSSC